MHHSMLYGLHIYIFDNVNCVYLEFPADGYMCHITYHSVSERNIISSPKSLRAFVCLSTFQIEMVQESSFSVSKETRSCDARVRKELSYLEYLMRISS